jgi:hypothetical protein
MQKRGRVLQRASDVMSTANIDFTYLRKQLAATLTLEEIQTLCADLGLDYEELPGEAKSAKCRALVKESYRKGKLDDLITLCQKEFPNAQWVVAAINADGSTSEGKWPSEGPWDDALLRLYELVAAFNRNRNQPFTPQRTIEGDDIAYDMRELAPFVFERFDVDAWLRDGSAGKRLAAIKYLDWLQDVSFLDALVARLGSERRLMQFHTLLTIDSLLDQSGGAQRTTLNARLAVYNRINPDSDIEFWKQRILRRMSEMGKD